jgi:transcriptional regulator with XRE-family HTH domain
MSSLKIGTHLRKIRIQQNRTIQEIADQCELSKSMVSKIETNTVVPSVSTLVKLAKSLGTNVSAFLDENGEPTSVVTRAGQAQENLVQTDRGYYIHPYAPNYMSKMMQPFLMLAKKKDVREHHVSHRGEEFVHVLEGRMKFHVGDVEYLLEKGDSLYFNSLVEHGFVVLSEVVRFINILTD